MHRIAAATAALTLCLLGCGPQPVQLRTGVGSCFLMIFPIWGRLLPDALYGTTLDGVPIIWPAGYTGVRAPDGGVAVAGADGKIVATTGNDYWLGNGMAFSEENDRLVKEVHAFPACAVSPATPENLAGGGIAMAAQPARAWLERQQDPPQQRPVQSDLHPDPRGDLVDGRGRLVQTHAYVDLRDVRVETLFDSLRVDLGLAAEPPARISPKDELVTYVVAIDTTDDGVWDYWLGLHNRSDGTFVGTFDDWAADGHFQGNGKFRGAILARNDSIGGWLPLAVLGDPSTIGYCVSARATDATATVLARDDAPEGDCLDGGPLRTLEPRVVEFEPD
jgi:hypothetical protein